MKLISDISRGLFGPKRRRTVAANEDAHGRETIVANVGATLTGSADAAVEWLEIPFGESSFGGRRQIFTANEAAELVADYRSWKGKASRLFFDAPVFNGHPEEDASQWPDARAMGHILEMETSANALRLKVAWNELGMANKEPGNTRRLRYPSPRWECWIKGQAIHPFRLLSVGMTNRPNIKNVPAWNEQPKPKMNPEQLKLLGLAEDATPEQTTTALNALHAKAAKADEALTTANDTAAAALKCHEAHAAKAAADIAEAKKALADETGRRTTEAAAAAAQRTTLANALAGQMIAAGKAPEADRPGIVADLMQDGADVPAVIAARTTAKNSLPSAKPLDIAGRMAAAARSTEKTEKARAYATTNKVDFTTAWNALGFHKPNQA